MVVVLSPHLDDAAFSAFHVLDHGAAVVITMCAAIPDGEQEPPSNYDLLTRSNDARGRYRQRVAEDLAAAATGGWAAIHLPFLDKPYRHGPLDPEDVYRELASRLPADAGVLYIPAAIGGHDDHTTMREAGLRIAERTRIPARLYADQPYAAAYGWPSWVTGTPDDPFLDPGAHLRRWLPADLVPGATPQVHRLDHAAQLRKLAAMRTYASQFPVSDGGPSRLLSHPQRLPFEVTWPVAHVGLDSG
jgi:LmbE family N-acetylglucosaminyl deacetylase